MGEELFSSNPVSYKMDRKSPEAFALRDAVNRKLFDFMGNYTDEVLAEYIVVLVCNGKHQNQARNDLEAFLGDDSGKFVAWLWDHLAKENYTSRTLMDSSSLKAEVACSHEDVSNKEQKSSSLPDPHINASGMSDIPLPKDGRYDPSYYSTNSNCSKVIEISESVPRWHPSINDALNEENNERLQAHLNEVNAERLQAEPMVVNKTSDAAYHSGATKHFSSTVRCLPPSGDEQLPDEHQHQKIAKIDSSALLHRPLPVPRTEPVARGLRSIITEDHQSRPTPMRNSAKIRLLSAAVDSAPHQIAPPRGNVWDRLGKPSNDDYAEIRGKNNLHDNNLIKRGLPECQGEELQIPRLMRIKQNARLSSDLVEESVGLSSRKLEHRSNSAVDFPHVNNSKRKRLYSESNSGNSPSFSGYKENKLQVKEALPKMPDSFLLKFNRSQSFSKVASDVKHSPVSESTSIPTRVEQNSQADKEDSVVSANVIRNSRSDISFSPQLNKIASVTSQTQKLVPKNSQLSYKSESSSKTENHSATRRPVKEVQEVVDVKSKLDQIESEVLDAKSKLRLKQAKMRTDAKPSALTGVQNQSEEDLESRTVLVTNVHFAATREALLSHFTKCGSVAKVVMLTDTITAQPKGAAYIVFANKDSVEKAVSMSRTSFFSRILTVMRKADMPPDFLVPSASAWKSVQPFYPQPSWKGSGHYTSTHLQWRRDNPANRENSITTTTNGMESSTTGA